MTTSPDHPTWRDKLSTFLEVAKLARASILVPLIAAIALLLPAQSLEALRVLVEDPRRRVSGLLLFWIATLVLTISAWWWGRWVLSRQQGVNRDEPGIRGRLVTHLPRICGLLPLLAGAIALLVVGPVSPFSIATLIPAAAWFWWIRRQSRNNKDTSGAYLLFAACGLVVAVAVSLLLGLLEPSGISSAFGLFIFSMPAYYSLVARRRRLMDELTLLRRVSPKTWTWVLGLAIPFVVAIVVFIFVVRQPPVARVVGPLAVVHLAAAVWLPFLAVLTRLGNRYRFPVLTIGVLIALLWGWLDWNDNHRIRRVRGQAAPKLQSIEGSFDDWLDAGDTSEHTLFVVAAEGGGIYAAYFTAQVLAVIQDKHPQFADQLFAISGVSGGSVGAAIFVALRAEQLRRGQLAPLQCDVVLEDMADVPKGLLPPGAGTTYQSAADCMLAQDQLTPIIAATLLPDLVQRFLPFPIGAFDRARALEASFETSFAEALGKPDSRAPTMMAGGFYNMYETTEGWLPNLVLNTTSVETGKRMVVSNVLLGDKHFPTIDTLAAIAPAEAPPLSTAAGLSARFPIVTPAGFIKTKSFLGGPWVKRRYVDGGYYENTGTDTLAEIVNALKRCVAAHPDKSIRIVAVRIGFTDSESRGPSYSLGEIMSPLRALLGTRGARGRDSVTELRLLETPYQDERRAAEARRRRETTGTGNATSPDDPAPDEPMLVSVEVIEFVLDTSRGYKAPLGWMLSERARREMRQQLISRGTDSTGHDYDNAASFRRIDELLDGPD